MRINKKVVGFSLLALLIFGIPYNFITGKRAPVIGFVIGKVRSLLRSEKELNLNSLDKISLEFKQLPIEVKNNYKKNFGEYFTDLSNSNVIYEKTNGFDPYFFLYVYGSDYECVLINDKYRLTGTPGNLCLFKNKIYYLKILNNRNTDFKGSIFYCSDLSDYFPR